RVGHALAAPHLGAPPYDLPGAAVAGVPHVLPVARAADQHLGAGDVAPHVAERVARECGDVEAARVVDVDRRGAHLEDLVAVVEAEDVAVRPVAQTAVLRQAVAADPGARAHHVATRC